MPPSDKFHVHAQTMKFELRLGADFENAMLKTGARISYQVCKVNKKLFMEVSHNTHHLITPTPTLQVADFFCSLFYGILGGALSLRPWLG